MSPDTRTPRTTSARPEDAPLSIEGIVLAGSYPWTGSTFESLVPRPLLPVAQTPLIEHVVGWLREAGIARATLCANGSTKSIRQHLQDGDRLGIGIRYHEDKTPRGAAGCVRDAAQAIDASTLLVADGTSIPLVDVAALLDHHRSTGAALTVAAYEPAHPLEAVKTLRPVGVYVFDRQIVDLVPVSSFQDIKENLVPRLYREGFRVEAFPVPEMSPRVMDAGSYLSTNLWMVSRLAGASSATDRSGLIAHATAWVDPDALIVGPVMLGAGVRIHAGATIIGPACVGAGSVIEPGAVLARSLTWEDCVVRQRSIVDRSFLAAGVEIAPETAVLNAIRATAPESGHGRSGFLDHRRSQPRASNPVIKPALS